MIFNETKLAGAFLIEQELFEDVRGFFARSWSEREFAAAGLDARLVECNISYNHRRGTLRGMHFQRAPRAQAKLVRCTMGAIYDAIIDLRPESPTFKQWIGVELTAENRRMLFVPEGFAHGFQTLVDRTEVFYQMSTAFAPEHASGVRWNDPAFGIDWPDAGGDGERIIIARDREYSDFTL
ncbi:MAG TPA: dTDP-4-dehydrorhamnose 3,5-epimerase [Pyrinomonadaceae bacterium]|nr:dTDP-4-dehydrorhamnose 3,5-epimerase [Pyrinomonadaceae bacterium]